jgi:hypothetical protein
VSGRKSTEPEQNETKAGRLLQSLQNFGQIVPFSILPSQVSFQIVRIKTFQSHKQNTNANSENTEGVGETRSLADALECHPEPGRRGATALRWSLHDAHRPV